MKRTAEQLETARHLDNALGCLKTAKSCLDRSDMSLMKKHIQEFTKYLAEALFFLEKINKKFQMRHVFLSDYKQTIINALDTTRSLDIMGNKVDKQEHPNTREVEKIRSSEGSIAVLMGSITREIGSI